MRITSEELSVVAGVVLSLGFSYIPGLKSKFDTLAPERKRLVMLGLLVLVSGAVYGLSCAGFAADLGIGVTCDQAGAIGLIRAFVVATIANQSTYMITPLKHKNG